MTIRTRTMVLALLGLVAATNQPHIGAQVVAPAGLNVGAYVYFPDGREVATWRGFGKSVKPTAGANEIYTMETLCVFSSDYKQIPSNVGYGWRFDVTHLKEAAGQVVVRVDWKRTRDRGRTTDSPGGSVVLALAAGKSVPLDYIVPGPDQGGRACDAVGMLLKVSLTN